MKQELNHIKPGDPIVVVAGTYTSPGVFKKIGPSGAVHVYPLYPGNTDWYRSKVSDVEELRDCFSRNWYSAYYNIHLSSYQRVFKITEDNLVALGVYDDYLLIKQAMGV